MWECSAGGFAFSLKLWEQFQLWHGFGTKVLTIETLTQLAGRRKLRLVTMDQRHSDTIHTLLAYPRKPLSGDGVITAFRGLVLVIKTADCLPVLFYDSGRQVVAAAHCGWQGTGLRLLPKMVSLLVSEQGCSLSTLQVALGPSIGPLCYEVGQDVVEIFAGNGLPVPCFSPIANRPGKYLFDLKASNRQQLLDAGIVDRNVFSLNYCTHCEKNLYSYRRDAQKAGRLLSFIGLCP